MLQERQKFPCSIVKLLIFFQQQQKKKLLIFNYTNDKHEVHPKFMLSGNKNYIYDK